MEPKKMALVKLYRAIEEEDGHPLAPFFQGITINYKSPHRQKNYIATESNRK